jgi:hypothetical protein
MNTQIQNKTTNLNDTDSSKPVTGQVDYNKQDTPKKKKPFKFILGGVILLLLVIGSAAALYLTQINQDVRQQASTGSQAYPDGMVWVPGFNSDGSGAWLTEERFDVLNEQREDAGIGALENDNGVAVIPGTETTNNGSGVSDVAVNETYTPGTPVSCKSGSSSGSLCNCAPNDLCKPVGGGGSQPATGSNAGQACFIGVTQFECVKRAVIETIVVGIEGGACEIGQRTECGVGCGDGQQMICGGGANGLQGCTWTDRCIGQSDRGNGEITNNQSCEGLKRVSGGEPSKGGFVGCSGVKNCFCQGSIHTGSTYSGGNVVCYDDYQNDSCGAPGVGGPIEPPVTEPPSTEPPATEPPSTEPPATEPPATQPPNSSPNPSPTPTSYYCNSSCETNDQCQTNDSNLICNTEENNRCRLSTNTSSAECQPAVGPMCLDIDLNDSQSGVILTEDPSFGDSVKFTCAEVAGVDHYIFRVIEPDNNIIDLLATGRTSSSYIINKSGKFFAQCQICTTSSDDSCNSYEALN